MLAAQKKKTMLAKQKYVRTGCKKSLKKIKTFLIGYLRNNRLMRIRPQDKETTLTFSEKYVQKREAVESVPKNGGSEKIGKRVTEKYPHRVLLLNNQANFKSSLTYSIT